MKRTRRIEITRYRRRATLDLSEPSAAEITEDGPEGERVLNLLRRISPVPEVASNAPVLEDVEPRCLPGRLSLLRLSELLRLRKRT